jgi:photosystem II stability/assembly factor-like uncharacterized protein
MWPVGIVLHTVDGGKTWTLQSSGTENTLVSICFVDPQNGGAVGEEKTILHTADGGKTWEKQKSPVPFYLMKVYFVTPQLRCGHALHGYDAPSA